jgi:hypothetical protein
MQKARISPRLSFLDTSIGVLVLTLVAEYVDTISSPCPACLEYIPPGSGQIGRWIVGPLLGRWRSIHQRLIPSPGEHLPTDEGKPTKQ